MVRILSIVVLASVLAPSSGWAKDPVAWRILVAGELPEESFDPTTCTTNFSPGIAPHKDGFVASFAIVVDGNARVLEFFWHRKHGLPPKVRKCITEGYKNLQWAAAPGGPKGSYVVPVSMVFLAPGVEGLAPIPQEAVTRSLSVDFSNVFNCLGGTNRVLLGITVDNMGTPVAAGLLQTNRGGVLSMEGLNCAIGLMMQEKFPAAVEDQARLALVPLRFRMDEFEEPKFRAYPASP